MKITVVGCGRLGTPYTVALAEVGHDVVGVEINPEALAALREGRCPFDEPGVSEYIVKNVDAGRLRFTDSLDEAVAHAELFFLAVPTPQQPGGTTMDITAVQDGIEQVARRLTRDVVLIGKSTVPVGTAEQMAALAADIAPAGVRMRIGWSPDFLREALSMETTLRPARLVLGTSPGDRKTVEAVARRAWAPFVDAGVELLVTDFVTAELTKAAANAFLSTKMSFINLVDDVCRAADADTAVVSRALGLDPRIGTFGLTPGLGWGGSCLGKDIRAFAERSDDLGAHATARFLHLVDEVNTARRSLAVDHARTVLGDLSGRAVAVWGASFKPEVGDISDSPALDVALRLHRAGATVRVYDPSVNVLLARLHPDLTVVDTARDAVEGADLLMVLTDWREFSDIDPAMLPAHRKPRTVIDARRCLDPQRWTEGGWSHQLLGQIHPRTRGRAMTASTPPLVLGASTVRHQGVGGTSGFVVAPARHLHAPGQPPAGGPHILIAHDLTPTDTAALDLTEIAAFCTSAGGPASHAVQVAYSLGIPTVVAAGDGVLAVSEGQMCALDGDTGTFYTGLAGHDLDAARTYQNRARARVGARDDGATGTAPLTLTGTIMRTSQAAEVRAAGADGLGLLATELLFLGHEQHLTDEEAHYQLYREIARAVTGAPVTLRTLDIGGDKDMPSLNLPREDNSFLGVRGLRLSLRRPDLFLPQLRAAYRAARDDGARLRLMFPMVTCVEEFLQAARMAREVRVELEAPHLPLGVMVEVPACALAIDRFVEHVDFLSIGTNDLAQYLTATSRTNPVLAHGFDPLHVSLTRTVHAVALAGAEHNIPVSACGGLSGDPVGAVVLASLGVTALTVALPHLPDVREALCRTDASTLRTIREDALALGGTRHLRDLVTTLLDL